MFNALFKRRVGGWFICILSLGCPFATWSERHKNLNFTLIHLGWIRRNQIYLFMGNPSTRHAFADSNLEMRFCGIHLFPKLQILRRSTWALWRLEGRYELCFFGGFGNPRKNVWESVETVWCQSPGLWASMLGSLKKFIRREWRQILKYHHQPFFRLVKLWPEWSEFSTNQWKLWCLRCFHSHH